MSDEKIERFIVGIEFGDGRRLQAYLIRPQGIDTMDVLNYMMNLAEKFARVHNLRLLPFVLSTGPLSPDTVAMIETELGGVDPEIAKKLSEATDYHTTVWLTEPGQPTHDSLWALH